MADARDYYYMARALALGYKGLCTTDPNPRVGCVLVKDDIIIGEGWHIRAGEGHAEINALEVADERTQGATAYVTLEPCCHYGRTPPCTQALLAAGIKRVLVAMEDPNPRVAGQGLAQLRAAGVAVECGVMESEAHTLNPGFVLRMRHGRPLVRCKLAMSLDGRTAMASGESRWITGTAARNDVQRLRARASAIMTGVNTILTDDPSLNVRLSEANGRQPLRVILDPELVISPKARTLSLAGPVLVLTAVTDRAKQVALEAMGVQLTLVPRRPGGLDLQAVVMELASREINEVHLECGPTLAGAMLRTGLIDEFIIYMAPSLMGSEARGLFHLPGLTRMDERICLRIIDVRPVGVDWRITAHPLSA